jgi:hypothetical protein
MKASPPRNCPQRKREKPPKTEKSVLHQIRPRKRREKSHQNQLLQARNLPHNEELQPSRKFAPHQERRGKNGMRNEEEEPPFYTKLLPPWVGPTCIGGKQN